MKAVVVVVVVVVVVAVVVVMNANLPCHPYSNHRSPCLQKIKNMCVFISKGVCYKGREGVCGVCVY